VRREYANGNRNRPRWTSRFPDPEGRESATPFPCWRATSVLQETSHQPAICHFAKEIDARNVLRADRKMQYDRMDFKSSLSRVLSNNGWVRVGS
jgi:hypothetical protein